MKIVTVPHPSLRQQSNPVTVVDDTLKLFISDLQSTLKNKRNPRGVGLSAPQVDETFAIFTMLDLEIDETPEQDTFSTFINPRIAKHSKTKTFGPDLNEPILEGCLSIPFLYGPVPRFEWIDLEFDTILGDKLVSKTQRFMDFSARVAQHELDHLNGVLFTDYIKELGLPLYSNEQSKKLQLISLEEIEF